MRRHRHRHDAAVYAMFEGALFPTVEYAAADVDDADLTQSDLNAMTGNMALKGVTDPITLAFYHRMNVGGDENDVRGQCLRYDRWPGDGDGKEEREEAAAAADDDDGGEGDGPLWLSSNDRPPPSWRRNVTSTDDDGGPVDAPFPPPCKYCGARRDFEFQILPQMLSCLSPSPSKDADNVLSQSSLSTTTTAESDLAVLLEAHSMIESGMDLPPGFKDRHDEAVANARRRLMGVPDGGGGGGIGLGGSSLGVDWGVIAVYTCTASCGEGGVVSEENGCYREEVAWMQPPLD